MFFHLLVVEESMFSSIKGMKFYISSGNTAGRKPFYVRRLMFVQM